MKLKDLLYELAVQYHGQMSASEHDDMVLKLLRENPLPGVSIEDELTEDEEQDARNFYQQGEDEKSKQGWN